MTHSTKTILLAQFFISFMMATLMSGILGLLHLGFTAAFLHEWGRALVIAWPIAFCLSLAVGPIAFKLAYKLQRFLP
ncbi:MAG: DUF2798 domain-containing protein [Paracoccaceae bacterium]